MTPSEDKHSKMYFSSEVTMYVASGYAATVYEPTNAYGINKKGSYYDAGWHIDGEAHKSSTNISAGGSNAFTFVRLKKDDYFLRVDYFWLKVVFKKQTSMYSGGNGYYFDVPDLTKTGGELKSTKEVYFVEKASFGKNAQYGYWTTRYTSNTVIGTRRENYAPLLEWSTFGYKTGQITLKYPNNNVQICDSTGIVSNFGYQYSNDPSENAKVQQSKLKTNIVFNYFDSTYTGKDILPTENTDFKTYSSDSMQSTTTEDVIYGNSVTVPTVTAPVGYWFDGWVCSTYVYNKYLYSSGPQKKKLTTVYGAWTLTSVFADNLYNHEDYSDDDMGGDF